MQAYTGGYRQMRAAVTQQYRCMCSTRGHDSMNLVSRRADVGDYVICSRVSVFARYRGEGATGLDTSLLPTTAPSPISMKGGVARLQIHA